MGVVIEKPREETVSKRAEWSDEHRWLRTGDEQEVAVGFGLMENTGDQVTPGM